MECISYPRPIANVDEALGQDAFDRAHAQLMSWRQAPGAYGNLHLHSCWGESSVLVRRYQGHTAYASCLMMQGFIHLYELTGDFSWRLMADDVVSNLFFLQAPSGGFFHASGEFEPTYTPEQSCPIHQGKPLLALLQYAAWDKADPQRVEMIRRAIDAHWKWFRTYWDRRGTNWKSPLPFPGFCGVTNQDLVVVAALASYAKVFGDDSRYMQYGQPVLETFLSPTYYHEAMGLFERGDQDNFVERSSYYSIIVQMLEYIHGLFPDPRIPNVVDNVCRQLFSAIHTGEDGMAHFAWGAQTDPKDKNSIRGWIKTPYAFTGYTDLQLVLAQYCQRHPSEKYQALSDGIARTIASYMYADGGIPTSLAAADPLFAVITRPEPVWEYLLHRLGKNLKAPKPVALPTIRRVCGPVELRTNSKGWVIFKDGQQMFSGLKINPGGVGIGTESVAGLDLKSFDDPQVLETVTPMRPLH